jgi:predicted O-methyltransferase YrrM
MRAPERLLAVALRLLALGQHRRLGAHRTVVLDALRARTDSDEESAGRAIAELRQRLSDDHRPLTIEDHGAGTRGMVGGEAKPAVRTISEIYGRAAATPAWGRILYRLVRALEPRSVLELGTNLGVSAAHLAAALEVNERRGGGSGRLVTIEGDAGLADLARENLARLGHAGRTTVLTGRFSDVLDSVKREHGPFDLAFIDGHHEEAATRDYWLSIRGAMDGGGCVAFDDIEPGRPVRRAWKRIVAEERAAGGAAVDLIGMGLLFTASR